MPADPSPKNPVDYPIHPLMAERFSPRSFDPRLVEPEVLRRVFEAARWAPSSRNQQPWRFIVATKQDMNAYQTLLGCLGEWNQGWAHTAPVLALSFAMTRSDDGKHGNIHAWHDTGLATGQLLLQCFAEGLVAHPMGGIEREKIRSTYQVPAFAEPVAAIAIGYLGAASVLSEAYQKEDRAPRVRQPQSAFVFAGTWSKAW